VESVWRAVLIVLAVTGVMSGADGPGRRDSPLHRVRVPRVRRHPGLNWTARKCYLSAAIVSPWALKGDT
jgi:hypothetical protein